MSGKQPLTSARRGGQVDLDSLDNNKAINKAGQIIGTFTPGKTQARALRTVQPRPFGCSKQ